MWYYKCLTSCSNKSNRCLINLDHITMIWITDNEIVANISGDDSGTMVLFRSNSHDDLINEMNRISNNLDSIIA